MKKKKSTKQVDNCGIDKQGVRWFPGKAEKSKKGIPQKRGDVSALPAATCMSQETLSDSPVALPVTVMLEGKQTDKTQPVWSVSHSSDQSAVVWICSDTVCVCLPARSLHLLHLLVATSVGIFLSRQDQPGLSQLRHNTCTSKEKNNNQPRILENYILQDI